MKSELMKVLKCEICFYLMNTSLLRIFCLFTVYFVTVNVVVFAFKKLPIKSRMATSYFWINSKFVFDLC